jgi:alpha-methylacyl-CoA racemase
MGPLRGLKILEFAGIGPGPFCGMVLADLGADVVRLDRAEGPAGSRQDFLGRGRRSVGLDLKRPEAVAAALRLIEGADALIEGFRPGVMERLGLGPDACLARNPRLVYGRMTGWGQEGPLAQSAGHDINYIALTGALWSIGRPGERPVPPLNLVGDYGGGGMLLAVGVLAALLEAKGSGRGQVVDAAMVDGAALLMAPIYAMMARGRWGPERGANYLDGAAVFYDTYECADGRWLAVGPIEPQFWAEMLRLLSLDPARFERRMEPAHWPALKEELAAAFRARTRDDWVGVFEGTDACVCAVLSM